MKKLFAPALGLALTACAANAAQTTLFSYQGRLHAGAGPATGLYDFSFDLYATGTGGVPLTTSNLFTAWPVTRGVFNVTLDFGNEFPGADRWLGIAVRTNGLGDFVALTPRQMLTPTPYAIHAMNAGGLTGTVNAGQLTGQIGPSLLAPGSVGLDRLSDPVVSNTFWRLHGNADTVPGTHFLGTTDTRPLEFRVNNQTAFRITHGTNFNGSQSVNVVAGDANNFLGTNAHGNFIAGGGSNWIGANAGYNVIGGGAFNGIATNALYATIPGGVGNSAVELSFAAGIHARANHRGSFVWNGDKGQIVETTADEQFLIGAPGGVGIGTNNPQSALHVHGTITAGTFAGNGAGLSNVTSIAIVTNAIGEELLPASVARTNQVWLLGGNAGTSNGQFLGTLDNQPLELSVNGIRAIRIQPYGGSAPSLVGGSPDNEIDPASSGAVIGGGGSDGSLWPNSIGRVAHRSVVGGGGGNVISSNAMESVIGGGLGNTVEAPTNVTFGYAAVISGGGYNVIKAGALAAVISGGNFNTNSGQSAVVPGGQQNHAGGKYSLAGGRRAKALHDGSFVWGDSRNADVSSTGTNQFLIRASGGVGIGTNNPQSALHVRGVITADGFVGDGSGLSNIVSVAVVTNVVDGSSLPANLARLNSNQVFTASNLFTGTLTATNAANRFGGSFTGVHLGDGSGLTNLPSAILAGVAFLNSNQVFTASNIWTGVVIATNPANQLGGTFAGIATGNGSGLTNLNASSLNTGVVSVALLPASVSLLGQSIESAEIADGTIVNADLHPAAAIADTKLATISTAGKVANSATTATPNNTADAIVQRDGSGNFSAGTITAAFTGSGANLTGLNASQLTSGTVHDNRLPANLARLNVANAFTAPQTITNADQVPLQVLGSQPSGTWFNLGNFSPGGRTWNVIASGTNNGEGAGKLLFRDPAQGVLMALSTIGNVGIGTVSPTVKLEVAGPVKATAFIGDLNPASLGAGAVPAALSFTNVGNVFVGDGAGLTGVNAGTLGGLAASSFWQLGGNAGTVAGTHFVGTTDNQPVEFKANGTRALRLEPNANSPNVIGGFPGNRVEGGAYGATVGGGGQQFNTNVVSANFGTVGGGRRNTATATYATVGGGTENQATNSYATVGGGWANAANGYLTTIAGGGHNAALGNWSTVGGGSWNQATNDGATIAGGENNISLGPQAAIGGGYQNSAGTNATVGGGTENDATGSAAVIGGGTRNTAGGAYGFIGGGSNNVAGGRFSTVAGGWFNSATNTYASVPGGYFNRAFGSGSTVGGGVVNTASNDWATVPGGSGNVAGGTGSFAAGTLARALHNGAFAWSDTSSAISPFSSTQSNQFIIRAMGGVGINTNAPGATLDVNGSIRVGAGTVYQRIQGGQVLAGASATARTSITFNFPSAFSTTPKVLVTVANDPGWDVDDTFAASVRRVTTTNCVINIMRVDLNGGWSQIPRINWQAWE